MHCIIKHQNHKINHQFIMKLYECLLKMWYTCTCSRQKYLLAEICIDVWEQTPIFCKDIIMLRCYIWSTSFFLIKIKRDNLLFFLFDLTCIALASNDRVLILYLLQSWIPWPFLQGNSVGTTSCQMHSGLHVMIVQGTGNSRTHMNL